MGIVDEWFDGILIFRGVICYPLSENSLFELVDVSLEAWFLCGVGFPVLISGLSPVSAGPSLLIHLGFSFTVM